MMDLSQTGPTHAAYRPQDQNLQGQPNSTNTLGHANQMLVPKSGQVSHPSTITGTSTLLASSNKSRTWPTTAGTHHGYQNPTSSQVPGQGSAPVQNKAVSFTGGRTLSHHPSPWVSQNGSSASTTHGRAGPERSKQATSNPGNRISDKQNSAKNHSRRRRRPSHAGNTFSES